MKHLQTLAGDGACDGADTGDIASRTVIARDQTEPDWVRADGENDWNSRCGSLRRTGGCYVAGGSDYGDLTSNQLRRQGRQSIVVAFGPTILDVEVLTVDVAGFFKAVT
jgi:hypothetical protein